MLLEQRSCYSALVNILMSVIMVMTMLLIMLVLLDFINMRMSVNLRRLLVGVAKEWAEPRTRWQIFSDFFYLLFLIISDNVLLWLETFNHGLSCYNLTFLHLQLDLLLLFMLLCLYGWLWLQVLHLTKALKGNEIALIHWLSLTALHPGSL
jgi:hypothetical protein